MRRRTKSHDVFLYILSDLLYNKYYNLLISLFIHIITRLTTKSHLKADPKAGLHDFTNWLIG